MTSQSTTSLSGASVALIGCGKIAIPHAQTLVEMDRSLDLHFCDPNRAAAEELAASVGATPVFHDDAERMLKDQPLQVVHILTPPASHFELTRQALDAGAHVIVEKPMSMSCAETDELIAFAERRGLILCADHSLLLMPCVEQALATIESGRIGRPIAFDCFYGHAESAGTLPYGGPRHWAYRTRGGVLLNLISHPASLLAEVLGPHRQIESVQVSRNVIPNRLPDLISIAVETEKGVGTITISMAHGNASRYVRVFCERGTISIDLSRQIVTIDPQAGPIGAIPKVLGGFASAGRQIKSMTEMVVQVARGKLRSDPGLRALVHRFYAAVESGGQPPVSHANAIEVARILDATLLHPALDEDSCE